MTNKEGSKFIIGSEGVKKSEAEVNILPDTPEGWSYDKYIFYEFQVMNYTDCHISFNGGDYFFLKANRGIYTTLDDPSIYSVKFKENDVEYEWVGKFGR